MKIVNGKKFYAADIKAARRIDGNGWDSYNGQNWQWYSLFYNPACGLVILKANNSGDCYGDYTDRYFENPEAFRTWCEEPLAYDWAARLVAYDWAALLGEIDEQDNCALDFVAHMLAGRETVPESMTADTLRKVAAFAAEQAERLT